MRTLAGFALAVLVACGSSGNGAISDGGPNGDASVERPPPTPNTTRDLIAVDLSLDLTGLSGTAQISIAGDGGPGLTLDRLDQVGDVLAKVTRVVEPEQEDAVEDDGTATLARASR